MADVRRDGVVVFAVILILPDPPEQLFRADHRALVFQQNTKNGKFGGREEDLFSVQQAAMRLYMKLQAAIGQRRPVLRRGCVVSLIAAKLRLDARDKLQRPKGFCHVIVRAQGQSRDFFRFRVFRRQHQNRIGMLLSDDSAQFEATHIGQHHIQDGRIHLLLIHELKRISRIVALYDVVAFIGQIQLDQIGNFPLIVDNEYFFLHSKASSFFILS